MTTKIDTKFEDNLDWVQAPPKNLEIFGNFEEKNWRKGKNFGKKRRKNTFPFFGNYPNYQKHKSRFWEKNFENLSTDLSSCSPELSPKSQKYMNFKVKVLGEVVINKINPLFKNEERKRTHFAASSKLKAPESNKLSPPSKF